MSEQKTPRPPAIIAGGMERGGVPAWDFLRRHKHWTLPPFLIPLFAIAGFALASFRERTGTVLVSAIVSASIWYFAPHRWTDKDGRPRMRAVWFARTSVITAGAWLSAASFTGMSWIMAAVLAGLVLIWGIPWFIHKKPRSSRADKAVIAEWAAWWQHHARQWSLHGSGVADVTSKGTMETLVVQLWKGHQTVRNVRDAAEYIESALAGYVRPGMVRVDADPHDPSRALVRLKRDDPLSEPSGWHPGMAITSVTEMVAAGFTESGETIHLPVLENWFFIGKSRSGKSNELSIMLAAITGSEDALVWLIDMKGGRAARPWLPAVDWCAVTLDEAQLMMTALKDEIKARATNADDSEEQLKPTREVPAIFLVIDETYEVTSVPAGNSRLAADLAVITSQGMGMAIHVYVLTQYGSLDESVRTEQTRGNLIGRMCFAVSRADHGQFALTDYAKLDASKLKQKGAFYYQLGPESSSAPGRGYEMSHHLVRQVAARHGAMPRLPLRLYASQHQETYDQRWSRLPQPFWRSAPQTEALSPSVIPVREPAVPESYDITAHALGARTEGDPQAMAARIEEEIASIPDADPVRMPTDEEIRSAVTRNKQRFARALSAAPPEGISPKQLIAASDLSRPWIMAQLKALSERGEVIKVEYGKYKGAEGADVMAAVEEIRASQDALLAGSR
jgi:hypothetical protein